MTFKIERNQEYYQALINKKTEYEGLFYVGVKTTGVFCRPTCPARKPKFENCEKAIRNDICGIRTCKTHGDCHETNKSRRTCHRCTTFGWL